MNDYYGDDDYNPEIDWYSLPPKVLLRYCQRMQLQPQPSSQRLQQMNHDNLLNNHYVTEITLPDDYASCATIPDDDLANLLPKATITQLAQLCQQHYERLEANEKDILPWFVYTVRNKEKLLKLKPALNSSISSVSKANDNHPSA